MKYLMKTWLAVLLLFVGVGVSWAEDVTYQKVTTAPADWSGEYLIVCEECKVAFNGSLGALDAAGNNISVEIENGKISLDSKYAFTISAISGENGVYSIVSASGLYIGNTTKSNGLTNRSSVCKNEISLSEGNIIINATDNATASYLAYNKAKDQNRFRYYTSGGQTPIQLYKRVESDVTPEGATQYRLVITQDDFNGTSYAANNGTHSSVAVCVDDESVTLNVSWKSNQVMLNGSAMQWQKGNGSIYNVTDLGTIKSVKINSTDGSFITFFGDSEHPSSDTNLHGGFFTINVGNATGKTSSVEVVFELASEQEKPFYYVKWSVDGVIVKEETLEEGASVEAPMVEDKDDNTVFAGWVTEEMAYAEEKPTYATFDKATQDVTYYAVFAIRSEEIANMNSISAYADGDYYLIDVYEGKYYAVSGNVTNKKLVAVDVTSAVTLNPDGSISVDEDNEIITDDMIYNISLEDEVYTLKNKQADQAITLRPKGNDLGTIDGGFNWTGFEEGSGEQSGRFSLTASGTNSSSAKTKNCLLIQATSWNSTSGKQEPSLSVKGYVQSNRGNVTEKSQCYASGYMWFVPTGINASHYTTLFAGDVAFKAYECNESVVSYYATFSSKYDVLMPLEDLLIPEEDVDDSDAPEGDDDEEDVVSIESLHVYVISEDCSTYEVKPTETGKEVYIPANTGVLLRVKTTGLVPDLKVRYRYTWPLLADEAYAYNALVPCLESKKYKEYADDAERDAEECKYYKLAYGYYTGDVSTSSDLGFWYGKSDGTGDFKVKAGTALLCLPNWALSAGVNGFAFDFDEWDEGVHISDVLDANQNNETVIYNMQGMRISKLQKGVNIVNGRKVLK